MERLTYYRLADSENMGYYLNSGVSESEAIQVLGQIESEAERLGISSLSELIKLLSMVQFTGRMWEIRRCDREQTKVKFQNGKGIEIATNKEWVVEK